ncbi:Lar family restriction alleviation protein [Pseudomonas aeruginosa]|uniref:Lar family restriction alleviation protein n=1 Tax=Pseudomonas aeruginosa TaxID=287 RepID=UPI0009A2DF2C|nr:Lar family restriction alleviation protein [Pseudomonas aeruginosa]EKW2387223.1 Lar family restriction alleviation protein [Pseudomonas aeruginosa]MBW6276235.1 Lar family restriction alleviation protein [Pseudomonas aeruginosa]MCD2789650.1 Lar family restriction alleviation protein [Pseudomonas aeruginosa]MCD2845960.1 Lar family restriction alleviation protein [Pseudomonas aeruginosa]MCD2870140.1 Lar family restriction alleviation protein [Pseudomonas aeruginosa]
MAEELKPCPFCGCSMRLVSNHDWHRIVGDHSAECVFLDSETMMVPDIEDQREIAIADWNARAAPAGHVMVSEGLLRSALTHAHNRGYLAGHHDTVEAQFSHILSSELDSYRSEQVEDILQALLGEGKEHE